MRDSFHPRLLCRRTAVVALLAAALAGCANRPPRQAAFAGEDFESTETHTREYPVSPAQACEAARRALLSQGYMVSTATAELVVGRKNFQPAAENHVELEFRLTCAREGPGDEKSIAFASALQDRYGIKKVNNNASLGVGALGSLSLPVLASDDAMVKLASQTVTDAKFYDGFFALLERFLSIEDAAAKAKAKVK
ncbi:DUF2242 domain-containing protein [Xylophilus sp.]|uniref:DUF2242 domain-containing protein n=1 Tax=Xylophilus sp. TaxID=2653893 RepID=UPI0013B7A046|nr:DUF2242 domain-containing protein [Xylophilus sp.]KAF1045546.1 MAG: hypothetical protein GAK38_02995 [Xylophilus sp.]